MGTVYNIRGCNGSGKTTLARHFLPPNLCGDERGGPVELNLYDAPTARDPERRKRAEGYTHLSRTLGKVGIVGRYSTACGGMDTMPNFATCFGAIDYMLTSLKMDHVIAEGILASTVFGSWGEFAGLLRHCGHSFAFVYLSTPLEVCKDRIRTRQAFAGKADKIINWELVDNKFKAIAATRAKAIAAGEIVYEIPWEDAEHALKALMIDQHAFVSRGDGTCYEASAREIFRATQ